MRSFVTGIAQRRRSRRLISGLLLAGSTTVLAFAVAHADVPQRFDSIPKRNVFGLKPPAPAEPKAEPQPEKPAVLLTGITTILGDKRALFKTRPPQGPRAPASPGATEQSFILGEGQREGPIEVLRIDENAGAVSVSLNGDRRTLTLERDGPSPPSGASAPDTNSPAVAGANAPAVPTFNIGPAPAPGSPPVPPAPAGNQRMMQNRLPRLPQTGSGTSSIYTTNSTLPLPPATSYSGTQPNPVISTPASTPPLPPTLPPTERARLTPEEQQLWLELQRLEAESRQASP